MQHVHEISSSATTSASSLRTVPVTVVVESTSQLGPSQPNALTDDQIAWAALDTNPDVPEVADIPEHAVVFVEHPDGGREVGIDCSHLPKAPSRRRGGAARNAQDRLEEEVAEALSALREQQAAHYRVTTLRRRRLLFVALVAADALFFLASLVLQLSNGGFSSVRRKGLTLRAKGSPAAWWLKPKDLTLEEISVSLIIDGVGIVSGLQERVYLIGMFMFLQATAAVLISLRGVTLLLLLRIAELAAAIALRSAVYHHQTLTAPVEDLSALRSSFLSPASLLQIAAGFCGVLCGSEAWAGAASRRVASGGPDRSTSGDNNTDANHGNQPEGYSSPQQEQRNQQQEQQQQPPQEEQQPQQQQEAPWQQQQLQHSHQQDQHFNHQQQQQQQQLQHQYQHQYPELSATQLIELPVAGAAAAPGEGGGAPRERAIAPTPLFPLQVSTAAAATAAVASTSTWGTTATAVAAAVAAAGRIPTPAAVATTTAAVVAATTTTTTTTVAATAAPGGRSAGMGAWGLWTVGAHPVTMSTRTTAGSSSWGSRGVNEPGGGGGGGASGERNGGRGGIAAGGGGEGDGGDGASREHQLRAGRVPQQNVIKVQAQEQRQGQGQVQGQFSGSTQPPHPQVGITAPTTAIPTAPLPSQPPQPPRQRHQHHHQQLLLQLLTQLQAKLAVRQQRAAAAAEAVVVVEMPVSMPGGIRNTSSSIPIPSPPPPPHPNPSSQPSNAQAQTTSQNQDQNQSQTQPQAHDENPNQSQSPAQSRHRLSSLLRALRQLGGRATSPQSGRGSGSRISAATTITAASPPAAVLSHTMELPYHSYQYPYQPSPPCSLQNPIRTHTNPLSSSLLETPQAGAGIQLGPSLTSFNPLGAAAVIVGTDAISTCPGSISGGLRYAPVLENNNSGGDGGSATAAAVSEGTAAAVSPPLGDRGPELGIVSPAAICNTLTMTAAAPSAVQAAVAAASGGIGIGITGTRTPGADDSTWSRVVAAASVPLTSRGNSDATPPPSLMTSASAGCTSTWDAVTAAAVAKPEAAAGGRCGPHAADSGLAAAPPVIAGSACTTLVRQPHQRGSPQLQRGEGTDVRPGMGTGVGVGGGWRGTDSAVRRGGGLPDTAASAVLAPTTVTTSAACGSPALLGAPMLHPLQLQQMHQRLQQESRPQPQQQPRQQQRWIRDGDNGSSNSGVVPIMHSVAGSILAPSHVPQFWVSEGDGGSGRRSSSARTAAYATALLSGHGHSSVPGTGAGAGDARQSHHQGTSAPAAVVSEPFAAAVRVALAETQRLRHLARERRHRGSPQKPPPLGVSGTPYVSDGSAAAVANHEVYSSIVVNGYSAERPAGAIQRAQNNTGWCDVRSVDGVGTGVGVSVGNASFGWNAAATGTNGRMRSSAAHALSLTSHPLTLPAFEADTDESLSDGP